MPCSARYSRSSPERQQGPPKQLVATPGDRQAFLTWSVSTEPDLASYYLYRHTARDSTLATRIDTLTRSDTGTTDFDLINGTTYWYWLSAVDSAGKVQTGYIGNRIDRAHG